MKNLPIGTEHFGRKSAIWDTPKLETTAEKFKVRARS